jgi:ABC-type Co2+ transport system permease subunit
MEGVTPVVLVAFLWFVASLFVALTALRLAQGYVSPDTTVGQALAFVLH